MTKFRFADYSNNNTDFTLIFAELFNPTARIFSHRSDLPTTTSYAHESPEHARTVLELSDTLRDLGIDCRIDQYEPHPAQGWPMWMEQQLEQADVVLVIHSERYHKHFRGEEKAGVGKGVAWESVLIRNELYETPHANKKFVPVFLSPDDQQFVLPRLNGYTRYILSEFSLGSDADFTDLYRRLTNQPATPAGEVGNTVPLPPVSGKTEGRGPNTSDAQTDDNGAAPISNLHRQLFVDRLFVGRETLLKNLHKALRKISRQAVTQKQAIHGLGGIGKTQLALEYARRYSGDYAITWWLRSEERATLMTDLADLAVPLGILLPGQNEQDQTALVNAVISKLSARNDWLLIYDNVDNKNDLRALTPDGGHVLITTRLGSWGSVAGEFEIGVMGKQDARKLLLKRSGQTDSKAADEVASRLGWLPLGLEVAAAYCQACGLPLSQYVDLLEEAGLPLLDEQQPIDYHHIFSQAWQSSLQQAIEESEHAATLLGVLAHLGTDDFPVDIIPEEVFGPLYLNAAIAALSKYSLIEVRTPKRSDIRLLSTHRLVQEVYRDSLPRESRESAAEWALALINNAFPTDSHDVTTWESCDRLLAHASAVTRHADDKKNRGEHNPLARLVNQIGVYYIGRANHGLAEPLIRRALAIDESSYGENHPNVTTSLSNLAQLLQDTNRLDEAEPLMRRALTIDESSHETNHLDIARDLNNLAQLLQDTNRLDEAEPLMRRVVSIFESSYIEDDRNLATSLNNLAQLLEATNRLDEAEPLIRRALSIDESSHEKNHPQVAKDLNNLAALLKRTNRLDDAEPLMRRALSINESWFSENHPEVAICLNNLAQLLQIMNRRDEAEPLMRRHVEIFRDFRLQTRRSHTHMQTAIRNYAASLVEMDVPKDEIVKRVREAAGLDDHTTPSDACE